MTNNTLPADFRLYVNVTRNRKTRRLMREMGDRAFYCIVSLWCYVAENCPDGNLGDMDADDLADASNWTGGTNEEWRDYLIQNDWLDERDGTVFVHDWAEMQPWACRDRSKQIEANRQNALKRWGKKENNANSHAIAMQSQCDEKMQLQCPQPNPYPTHILEHNAAGDAPAATTLDTEDGKSKVKTSQASHITLDRTTWKVEGIADDDRTRWHDAAPLIDVDTEIVKFQNWCMSNPDRAPRIRIMAAVTRWMNKAQEFAARNPRATSNTYRTPTPAPEAPRKVEWPMTFVSSDAFDWGKVRGLLHDRLDAGQYAKWIERIEYVGMSGDTVGLSVADAYIAKHIQANFMDSIKDAIWDVYRRTLPLHMMVRDDAALRVVND